MTGHGCSETTPGQLSARLNVPFGHLPANPDAHLGTRAYPTPQLCFQYIHRHPGLYLAVIQCGAVVAPIAVGMDAEVVRWEVGKSVHWSTVGAAVAHRVTLISVLLCRESRDFGVTNSAKQVVIGGTIVSFSRCDSRFDFLTKLNNHHPQ